MSSIKFHSEHGEAVLRGSERAYARALCNDLMFAVIGDMRDAREWLAPLLPPGHWCLTQHRDTPGNGIRLWLGVDGHFIIHGKRVAAWIVALNTAWAIGSDPVRLLARLHGQCEIHCYIEGANRKWLASIMRDGRATGVLRDKAGWEEVIDLLESRDDGPVVCSYSVTDSFPSFSCLPENHPLAQRDDEQRFDDFYELAPKEAWRLCADGLRAKGEGLEIKPEGWATFHFDSIISAFTLRNPPAPPHGEGDVM